MHREAVDPVLISGEGVRDAETAAVGARRRCHLNGEG